MQLEDTFVLQVGIYFKYAQHTFRRSQTHATDDALLPSPMLQGSTTGNNDIVEESFEKDTKC